MYPQPELLSRLLLELDLLLHLLEDLEGPGRDQALEDVHSEVGDL